jgi:hypothetical protein
VGNHHGDYGDNPEEEFEGDIGSGIEVGQEQGQKGGDKTGANGEYDRIDNDASESRIGVGLDVLFQSKLTKGSNTLREASKDKHDNGAYGQKPYNGNKARRQCLSGIKHLPVHLESTKQ